MPRLIVVGNEKGGSGKTMTAVNLAACGARDGMAVLLVDTDGGNQMTSTRWAASRAEWNPGSPPITTVKMQGSTLRRDLLQLGQSYDLVVVDTAPADTPELRSAMAVADVLVVPVKPSNFELWALPPLGQLFDGMQSFNPKLASVIAINRIQRDVRPEAAISDVSDFINEHAQGLSGSSLVTIYERVAFDRASGKGLGAVEWQKGLDKAAEEVLALWTATMAAKQQELSL